MKKNSFKSERITFCFLVLIYLLFVLNTNCAYGASRIRKKPLSSRSLRSMARVYMACGNYAKAKPLAEKALNQAQLNHVSDAELSMSLIDLAYLYNSLGMLDDAEEMCRLGLKLQEKIYYDKHPYIAYTLRTLSDIYKNQGKYDHAKTTLDTAINIMLDSHLPDNRVMTQFYIDRGKLLVIGGDFDEAEKYYERAKKSIDETYGSEHLFAASLSVNFAELYLNQGKLAEATQSINHAITIQEKTLGAEHRLLAPTWVVMAKISQASGQYSQAESLLQKALNTLEDMFDQAHPEVQAVQHTLSQLHKETTELTEVAKL